MSAETLADDGGWHRGDWMQTYTGGRFYPLDAQPEDVNPLDIAHALSMLCRYNGHVDRFYSVAEHCILMSEWIESETGDQALALEGLLHDGSEAYCGDMVRPLKHSGAMGDYIAAEDRVMVAIAERFGLRLFYPSNNFGGTPSEPTYTKPAEVKEADTRILLTERTALMSNYKASDRWSMDGMAALPVTIEAWSPAEAEARYLARLSELGIELPQVASRLLGEDLVNRLGETPTTTRRDDLGDLATDEERARVEPHSVPTRNEG